MRSLELLAPAKNLECGIAAIDHGADAVYIGAQRFGARAAAGNSLDDIKRLCDYAHRFGARVYVTVNTIIYEEELTETQKLIHELYSIGADAILVQDMGILEMDIPPIEFHASTQADNRSIEKVQWLYSHGFKRIVLARELSLDEIRSIHEACSDVELEVFVHGALCVSYSGQCYASQVCFNRSANRGECAQFCRLKFDLKDADGTLIEHQRHLLSLKDMCRIDELEALADAGATSFKIEGRLKDAVYVKNVVAAYSQRLNEIVAKYPEKYCRQSLGRCQYNFHPALQKTFNRGFTTYFLDGRKSDIVSFDTPKALGEYVGKVKEVRGNSFNVAGTSVFANGDGLCYFNSKRELEGFRVNRVENNRLYPLRMPSDLSPGTSLYRNNDIEFERLLAGKSSVRKIPVIMILSTVENGFQLEMRVIDYRKVSSVKQTSRLSTFTFPHQPAQKPQRDNIVRQLSKLGDTPFMCEKVDILGDADRFFIPSSLLAEARRAVTEQEIERKETIKEGHSALRKIPVTSFPAISDSRLLNVSNSLARLFYQKQGLNDVSDALELSSDYHNPLVMQCRYCLRYQLGFCVKHGGEKPRWREPLFLCLSDGRRFRLQFDCQHCQMNIYAER